MLVSMYGQESGRMYVGDSWFLFFLGKMFLVVVMVLLAVYVFEILAPRMARQAAEGPSARLNRMQKTQRILALTGFVLALVIVLFSAAL
jgi:putative copper export protein